MLFFLLGTALFVFYQTHADALVPGSQPVAIVSESFARDRFRGRSPVGQCIRLGSGDGCLEVVGVAHVDPAREGIVRELAERLPAGSGVNQAVDRVLETGTAELVGGTARKPHTLNLILPN
mgnify:CR=1 FL=1